jgi:hypothetical protein
VLAYLACRPSGWQRGLWPAAELSSLAAAFDLCLAVISAIVTITESAAATAHLCLALAVFGLSLCLLSFVLDRFRLVLLLLLITAREV